MDITLKIAIIGAIALIIGALIKLLGDLISKGSSGGLISTIIILILAVIGGGVFVLYLPTPTSKSTEAAPPVNVTETQSASNSSSSAFTGIWQGTDPSDGSITTISLTQNGNVLTGVYNDSYSGNTNPPGWHGEGSGTILSPTTAHIIFNVSRWDNKTGNWDVQLTISNGNNTLMLNNCIWQNESDTAGCPMVMQRQ